MLELAARIKAIFRRAELQAAQSAGAAAQTTLIEAGELSIDLRRHEARLAGRAVELTAKEFELLACFARSPGRVFTRMQLLDLVWGYSHSGYEHTVNTHNNRLRNKIERDPANPEVIQTVWGRAWSASPCLRGRLVGQLDVEDDVRPGDAHPPVGGALDRHPLDELPDIGVHVLVVAAEATRQFGNGRWAGLAQRGDQLPAFGREGGEHLPDLGEAHAEVRSHLLAAFDGMHRRDRASTRSAQRFAHLDMQYASVRRVRDKGPCFHAWASTSFMKSATSVSMS
jgi:hypothetical protein